ncbi:MAG: nucleotidyl transferase AbiEii/AbiGii toxin family protein [Candidatus Binatia bacterium]
MTLAEGVVEVASFLGKERIPYAILGGIAVQHWGEPRATLDIDVVVLVPPEREDEFLNAVLKSFRPRLPDAVAFAKRNRILLISTSGDIPVDLSLGIPGYEEEALRRAVTVSFGGVSPVRVVSPEDLIIHKCVAGRARDIEDIERVLVRQKLKLDLQYVRKWLRAFAPIVEAHDVRKLFESAIKKARSILRKI